MDAHVRDLRYFAAVAEELSFTRAAERLYVSQPALSKQIRALERQLGFPLFERRARTIALTPQGAALLPAVRELTAGWAEAVRAARTAGPAESLAVGMQTAVGRDLQREVLGRFRERGWRISLRLVNWEDPTAGLAGGGADAAFCWLPVPGVGAELTAKVLAREERWVALPLDHRFAGRTAVDFADLLDEPFVALPRSAGVLRDFWLGTAERGGREPVVALEASAPEEVFEAVGAGLGVVLLAEGNARLYPRPDVVSVPVRGLAPCELALLWRTADGRREVAEFAAAFREAPAPAGGGGGSGPGRRDSGAQGSTREHT
ncbi:LysR family transcriptional regulator [Streptomyces sp. CNQ-509]|uniref:LysR substrate-binding domain-containing protein n=1 Tax=unclassified Streptomyces TaxID=2593676 RepID=UPI00062E0571|nr:LysR substrate-binding domain-containing protein [Streptomyces sp. CNQ-509]AKH82387.1 LysR family transcriptional regulator [Streptomyces sp. CNQ-509]